MGAIESRVELKDGSVLIARVDPSELRALVDRSAPGRVGLPTREGHRLVPVREIARVDPVASA